MERRELTLAGNWEEATLDDYSSVLYRRKWIILLMVAVAASVAVFVSQKLDKQYEAKAVLYVPPDAGTEGVRARLPSGVQDHAKANAELLKQPSTWQAVNKAVPGKPLERYSKDVDIVIPREATIRVFVRDKDKELAARIANEFVSFYNRYNRDIVSGNLQRDLDGIDTQLKDIEDNLAKKRDEYREYLEKNKIASVDTLQTEIEKNRSIYEQELNQRQMEVLAANQRVSKLQHQLDSETQGIRSGEIALSNPMVESMQRQVSDLEVQLAAASKEMTAQHPDRIALESQLATARENLEKEKTKLTSSKSQAPGTLSESLRQQLVEQSAQKSADEARVAKLQTIVGDLDKQILSMPMMKLETTDLDQQMADLRAERAKLRSTRNDLVTKGIQQKDPGVTIQTATPVGLTPVFPIIPLNAVVAGLCGLVLGVLYAFLIEHVESRQRIRRIRRLEMEEWVQALMNPRYQNGNSIFDAMNLQSNERASDKILLRSKG